VNGANIASDSDASYMGEARTCNVDLCATCSTSNHGLDLENQAESFQPAHDQRDAALQDEQAQTIGGSIATTYWVLPHTIPLKSLEVSKT
jgi:hypothetical protein